VPFKNASHFRCILCKSASDPTSFIISIFSIAPLTVFNLVGCHNPGVRRIFVSHCRATVAARLFGSLESRCSYCFCSASRVPELTNKTHARHVSGCLLNLQLFLSPPMIICNQIQPPGSQHVAHASSAEIHVFVTP
jgi:hypothetical protein